MRGRRRHRGRCRTCGTCRCRRTCRCGPAHHHSGSGGRGFARRPGVLVVRRTVLRRLTGAAPPAYPRLPRACTAGLARLGRLRSRRGSLAAPLGRSLRRFRRGREARLAAPAGPEDFPDRRLGRARRISGDRPWQLGPALSRHMGHGTRRDRALRAACARGEEPRPRLVPLQPSRHWTDEDGRRDRRRAGRGAGAERCGTRTAKLAPRGRLVRVARAGDHRHVGRHRRQS